MEKCYPQSIKPGYRICLLAIAIIFTSLIKAQSPGGVSTNLSRWYEANVNASATLWGDVSPNAKNTTLVTGSISYVSTGANFNPYINFNNGYFSAPGIFQGVNTDNTKIFTVNIPVAGSNNTSWGQKATNGNNNIAAFNPNSNLSIYFDAPNGYRTNTVYSTAGGIYGTPVLIRDAKFGGSNYIHLAGKQISTAGAGTYTGNYQGSPSDPLLIGAQNGTTSINNLAELIIYENAVGMTATQVQQIESYLALKYGVTLDQSTPTDYLASDGSVFWNSSTGAAYNANVAGIGRDDASGLWQKQSVSANTVNEVAIGIGSLAASNAANTNNAIADKTFLMWGDNGQSTGLLTAITNGAPGGLQSLRMNKVWRVQRTGSFGTLQIAIPASAIQSNCYLVINNADGTFSSGNSFTALTPLTLNGQLYYATTATLANGAYFTFAAQTGSLTPAPGGVAGAKLWLKADAGTSTNIEGASVSAWGDMSGSGNPVSQAINVNQPVFKTSASELGNFNPMIKFASGQSLVDANGVIVGASIANANAFVLARTDTSGTGYAFSEAVTTGTTIEMYTPSGTTAYWDGPQSGRISLAWGGTFGIPNIWTGYSNAAEPTNKRQLRRDGFALVNGTGATGLYTGNGSPMTIGGGTIHTAIGEIIVYTSALTTTDRSKIESYLAIKYGRSLDQTAATNYVASDNTTIWNATTGAAYKSNIAGIGRDDASGLWQKQSASTNTLNEVAIGAGTIAATNAANTDNSISDRSFLIWGDNAQPYALSAAITVNAPSGAASTRLSRVWMVQKTGTVGTVQIAIPASLLPGTPYLVTNTNDPTFGNSNNAFTALTSTTIGGQQYYATSTTLANLSYFTFSSQAAPAPGGVAGAKLWLKADAGTSTTTEGASVALWGDMSGSGNPVSQILSASQPTYKTSASELGNFNPMVKFLSNQSLVDANGVIVGTGLANSNAFVLARTDASGTGYAFSEAVTTGTTIEMYTPSGTTAYWDGPQSGRINAAWGGTFGIPNIWTGYSNAAEPTNKRQLRRDGFALVNGTTATGLYTGNGSPMTIGGGTINAAFGEIILYTSALTTTDRSKIESYLAIKYGRSLDQTSATNYVASDNTTIWNATTGAAYKTNIAGIGRDDASGLWQKQSSSTNSTTEVTIGAGSISATNAANTDNSIADKSFLIWGDNAQPYALSAAITVNAPSGAASTRLSRVWMVQRTGTVGTVQIAIPAALLPGTPYLVTNTNDATFGNSNNVFTALTAITIGGQKYYAASAAPANLSYFTFSSQAAPAPGGVAGAKLWLKADAGTSTNIEGASVSAWGDMSGSGNPVSQAINVNQPVFKTSASELGNFNPMVKFTSGQSLVDANGVIVGTGIANANAFVLARTDTSGTGYAFSEAVTTGTTIEMYTPSGTTAYWDGPQSGRINAAWGGTFGIPNIWTGYSNAAEPTNKRQLRRDGFALVNGTGATGLYTGNGSPMTIGGGTIHTAIGEIIVYTSALTTTDRSKIESYLAIKYGRSLDQTAATNYVASDNSTIWNASTGAAYKTNIAGIGRDDASGLWQKQSASTNTLNEVAIGAGTITATNTANTDNSITDKSFLIWGDNGQLSATNTLITSNAPAGIASYRMAKVWMVQKVGTVGTVQIAIPASTIQYPCYLVTNSTDGAFGSSNTFTSLTPISIGGVSYYTCTTSLTNNSYFTFATQKTFPGGVATNLSRWYAADNNASSTAWADASPNNQNTNAVTGYINYISTGANFNPYMNFNLGYFSAPAAYINTSTDNTKVFSVSIPVVGSNNTSWGQYATNGNNIAAYNPNSNLSLYFDAPNGYRTIVNYNTAGMVYGIPTLIRDSKFSGSGYIHLAGKQVMVGTGQPTAYFGSAALPFYIGAQNGATSNNNLAELIMYENASAMTAQQVQQIESYLAIKYGVALDQTVTATNYLASDPSVVFWNSSTNGAYKYSIAGIGRDDASGLLQKQSASVNSPNEPAIALTALATSNQSNTGSISADKSFLTWGDNGLSFVLTNEVTSGTGMPGGGSIYRTDKVWKVQKTGSIGPVQVALPTSALANVNGYLVTSNDPAFASGNTFTALTPITVNGTDYYATTANFTSGLYFTFAKQVPVAPGGVNSPVMWVKADAGFNYGSSYGQTGWADQSGNGNDAVIDGGAPGFGANTPGGVVNFNSAVEFNGTSDLYRFNANVSTDYTMLGAAQMYGTSKGRVFSAKNVNSFFGFHNGNEDRLYMNATPNIQTGNAANNNTRLYNLTRSLNGAYNMCRNGWSVFNGVTSDSTSWQPSLGGYGLSPSEYSSVYIPEFIAYDYALSAAQKQRVESYLAIKYGVQLYDVSALGATLLSPASYYGSDWNGSAGTILWNSGTNAGYNNCVTVIGRDDAGGLNQKQSKSAEAFGLVTVALGGTVQTLNAQNTNTFGADKTFEAIGDNGGSFAAWSTANTPASRKTLSRVWKVQETGTVQSIHIQVPDNSSTLAAKLPSDIGSVYLLVDADGDFTSGATEIAMTASGTTWNADVDLANGQYFTFATNTTATPGGVVASSAVVSPATLVNGIYYELYNGFYGPVEDGIVGTLNHYGYLSDFTNVQNILGDDIGSNYSLVMKAKINIANPGNYKFQATNNDDRAAIFVDDVLLARTPSFGNGNVPTDYVNLTAGLHNLEFRFSQGTGGSVAWLQWASNALTGLDVSTAFAEIPAGKLFVTAAPISVWYKADAGVAPATDAATVSTWSDQSGNGNTATTTNGTLPRYYTTTAANLFNFNPTVTAAASSNMDAASEVNGLTWGQQAHSMFVVARSNSSTNAGYMFGWGRDDASNASDFRTASPGQLLYGGNRSTELSQSAFWTYPTTTTSTPRIMTGTYQNLTIQPSNNEVLYGDGKLLSQSSLAWTTVLNDHEDMSIMTSADQGTGFIGSMAEAVVYPWLLSATEKNKVESYLATKYGLTLDQTTPVNYVASDGSVYWDASGAYTTYKNNITIIGRDDAGGLDQAQSKSQNLSGGLVTIGLGAVAVNNASNPNTFTSDLTFEGFADNGGSISAWSTTGAPTGQRIIARNWKVQETGTVGPVHIQVPDDGSTLGVKLLPEVGNIILLVDDDNDFTTGATAYQMTLNGTLWETDVDFNNGQYFTFATLPVVGPGNVITNNVLWLKADAGVVATTTVSAWSDISAGSWSASQAASANQPLYNSSTGLLNFNPTLGFTGSQDLINTTNLSTAITSTAAEAYLVGAVTAGTTNNGAFSINNAGTTDISSSAGAVFFRRNSINNFFSERAASGALGSATGLTANATYINEAGFSNAGSGSYFQYVNAKDQVGSPTSATTAFNANHYSIGCRLNAAGGLPSDYLTGSIAEVILYKANNTAADKQKIRSYLAIKYGQTLDQTTPYDYMASDGTTKLWDATANSAYKNNITVIGRDDATLLYQKQSRAQNNGTVNTAGLVTMAIGGTVYATNALNTNTFTDKNFEAFADNGGDISVWTPNGAPTTRRILARTWKVQETGSVGSVRIQIPDNTSAVTTPKLPVAATAVYLLLNSGTDFTSGATEVPMTLVGTNWEANVNFTTGQFFTIATQIPSLTPTCIPTTTPYVAGQINTWNASLTAGTTYRFSSCGTSEDTYLSIYTSNGTTLVASSDNNGPACSTTAASIDFIPSSSGVYYIALSHAPNTVITTAGTLTYQLLTGYPPTYGTTSWNGYVYNDVTLTTFLAPISGGYTNNNFNALNINYGTAAPTTTSGCTSGTDHFGTRHAITANLPLAYYRFVWSSDDGIRISTQGQSQIELTSVWDVANTLTSGTVSGNLNVLLSGQTNIVVDEQDNTGGALVNTTVCQMGGGDLTGYGTSGGAWNVYAYTTGNYNFLPANYGGWFTSGSSTSTSATLSLTDVSVANSRTGNCGVSVGSGGNQSIRALLSNNFSPGAYTVATGADDLYRLSLDGGSTFALSGTCCAGLSSTMYLSGVTNLVYQGYNTGSGGIYNVSIVALAPVAGTLVSNQVCGGSANTTITLSGYTGYIQWQSSTDGNTWANAGSLTTNGTLAINPSVTTFYRAVVNSNATTATSNTLVVVSGPIAGNFTIGTNVTLGGTITVSGNFTLNSGATITVPQGCPFRVDATNITINGTINADGAGNLGGAGGAGGYPCDQVSCTNTASARQAGGGGGGGGIGSGTGYGGAGGSGIVGDVIAKDCGTACINSTTGKNDGGAGGGGGGGGSYGGLGGAGLMGGAGQNTTGGGLVPTGGAAGSATAIYGVNDISTETVSLGSGGGGSGGGGGGSDCGGAGADGGAGGGAVYLNASQTLTVSSSASISANGGTGGTGGAGSGVQGRYDKCSAVVTTCAGYDDGSGGGGTGGGGGSGGAILLEGLGNVVVQGILSARGGNGGIGGPAGNTSATAGNGGGGGGGGRVKIISNPCATNNINPTISVIKGNGGNGLTAGNNGVDGTYYTGNHPSYSPLAVGAVSSGNTTICTGGTLSPINASVSTGGLGTYNYQWYATISGCASPTTGTSSAAAAGWLAISANANTQNLSVAGINQAFADLGGLSQGTTYCFQRRTQSGQCYGWTTSVSVVTYPAPTVGTAPANIVECAGGTSQFTTAGAGGTGGAFSYQWYTNGSTNNNTGGTSLGTANGANTNTYTPPSGSAGVTYYYCVISQTGALCTVTTNAVSNTVNAAVTPSVSIAITAGANPSCTGSNVTFTATPVNGGTPTYQWRINGVNQGSASAINTFSSSTLTTGNVVDVVMASTATCASPATATSNTVTMTVNACITNYVWTGVTSTSWFDGSNWQGGVSPPLSCSSDVVIPVVSTHYPVVATTPVSVGNVSISSGAQMSLLVDMTICGNWSGGGSGTNATVSGSASAILQGGTTHVITGKTSFNELRLNNTSGGVTMTGAVIDIYTSLDLQKGNFDATGGALTFKSVSTTHCGIIDNFSYGANPGTITGTIYAERYYDAATAYVNQHFMGSPVNNIAFSQFGASGTAGFVTPTANCDEQHTAVGSVYGTMFSYHESNGGVCGTAQWKVEVAGSTVNGVGYSVARPGAGTLTVNGTPNLNSSYTVNNLANSGWSSTSLQGHSQTAGWQLLSNPYLAPLEIKTSNSDIEDQVQLWNANGPFTGTYQPGMVNSSAFIAPFQAFMIHKTTAGGTAGYTINGTDRVRTLHTFFSQNANELKITAENTATNMLDQTTVAFNPGATEHFDTHYDANKFAGSLTRHTLYTVADTKWMAINTLHSIAETGAVPMGFEPGKTGNYTFTFDGVNTFDPTSYIYLEDKALNVMYDVRNGAYSFTADSADNWNRFILHFTPPVEITPLDVTCNTSGSINIVQRGTAHWTYTITDSASNSISAGTIDQSTPVYVTASAGTYTLTLTDITGYTVTKQIQVNGFAAPVATFTVSANSVPEMQNLVVESTTPGATNYQWDFGNGVTATGQSVTTAYASTGIYNIVLVVTDQNGCSSSTSQVVTVTHLTTTGVADLQDNSNLDIWSSENNVFVDFTAMHKVDATITIFNVLGQEISSDKFTTNTVYRKEIDNIEAVYMIVRVKNADKIVTKKVFVVNTK